MTSVTFQLEDLTKLLTLSQTSQSEWVTLRPGLLAGIEVDPNTLAATPAIMASAAPVASKFCRYTYRDTAFVHLGYVLEQGANRSYGQIFILSRGQKVSQTTELLTLPALEFSAPQTYATGSIPVTFSAAQDTTLTEPTFTVHYRITASGATFPRVLLYNIGVAPL